MAVKLPVPLAGNTYGVSSGVEALSSTATGGVFGLPMAWFTVTLRSSGETVKFVVDSVARYWT